MKNSNELQVSLCKVTTNNIHELIDKGIISCVVNQDWSVGRIVPDFCDALSFKKSLVSGSTLLHLGIGNGECYKYFNNINIKQTSISDKLYFDPSEIIIIFLLKCGFAKELAIKLGEIMRNEFLIAISYRDLFSNNKEYFTFKDISIANILKSNYDITKSHSYNVLDCLLYLLNNNPKLLFPICVCEQRILTPMGKKIKVCKIEKIDYTTAIRKMNKTITLYEVFNYLLERFSNISDTYLIDFMSLKLSENIVFDYILATRSDAFLKKDYYSFLVNIISHLKPNGFYISDGVVSSYDYVIFYQELVKAVKHIGEGRVLLISSLNKSLNIPLRDILGIVVLGSKASITDVCNFINPKQIIRFSEVLNNMNFIRQCAWSNLVEWSRNNSLDLESVEPQKIVEILDKYIVVNGKLNFDMLSPKNNSIFETLSLHLL